MSHQHWLFYSRPITGCFYASSPLCLIYSRRCEQLIAGLSIHDQSIASLCEQPIACSFIRGQSIPRLIDVSWLFYSRSITGLIDVRCPLVVHSLVTYYYYCGLFDLSDPQWLMFSWPCHLSLRTESPAAANIVTANQWPLRFESPALAKVFMAL